MSFFQSQNKRKISKTPKYTIEECKIRLFYKTIFTQIENGKLCFETSCDSIYVCLCVITNEETKVFKNFKMRKMHVLSGLIKYIIQILHKINRILEKELLVDLCVL